MMTKIKNALKAEFITGRTTFDWIFLLCGICLQTFAIVYGFMSGNPESWVSIVSGLTGIVAVVLCAQGKISFYVFGYIQLLTYVFGIAIPFALWGEVIENIFYFVTMVYGTYIWFKNYKKKENGSTEIAAKKLSKKGWIISIALLTGFTVATGLFLTNAHLLLPTIFTEADPTPWLDAITTVAPFIAQIFMMLGYRDQWAFWIVEDIISIIMFIILGSWVMVAQYLFWTVNCIYGWYMWSRANKEESADVVQN
jgi:nicotinamide mononucleotide transporter